MGETFSKPTINPSDSQDANPSNSTNPTTNMSSASPKSAESDPQSLDPKTTEGESDSFPVNPESKLVPPNSNPGEGEGEEDEEEGEGECGFCLYMKGGGCKDAFLAWEDCISKAKEDENYVDKCAEMTMNLTACMRAHSDYYEPILRAEKAAEQAAEQEVMEEQEKEKEAATNPSVSEQNVSSKDLKLKSGSQ